MIYTVHSILYCIYTSLSRLEHMELPILTTRPIWQFHVPSIVKFAITRRSLIILCLVIISALWVCVFAFNFGINANSEVQARFECPNTLSSVIHCVIHRVHILIYISSSYLVLINCHFRFNRTMCNNFITFISYIFRYFITENKHNEVRKL